LIANIEQAVFMRQHGQKDGGSTADLERWIGFLPLYHAFGQLFCILVACKLNIPVYVMKTFQFEPFLRVIETFKITHLQTAPPVMVMINKRPETARYDLRSLKNILCGAAPLSKELQNAVSKQLGVTVNQIWGMTELTCAAIQVSGGMIDDSGSVGMLFPNVEAKLVNDDGREVGVNHPGELYVRGPNVCLRYWRNEKATRESLNSEGWLQTGDVAVINEHGMFWIVDRKKELIKVNGLQVAPAELEGVLLKHENIADAAVVGITM
jgi:acyl-CoA synthetase (AMP-forming)/AMP-acid ligase II